MNGEERVEASLEKISSHHNMVYRARRSGGGGGDGSYL